jgi:NTE family protein
MAAAPSAIRHLAGSAGAAIFPRTVSDSPLALVLSGGGARAAYQVGVLSALAELAPRLEVPIITGVSAGAINALALAAHWGPFDRAVRLLRRDWSRLEPRHVFDVRTTSLMGALGRLVLRGLIPGRRGAAVHGVLDPQPLRQFLARRLPLTGVARNIDAGRLRAVALTATCYGDGATVTFVQGAPDIPTWSRARRYAVPAVLTVEHVLASSAIPLIFPAVRLEPGFFGDGSVRQTAPLAPAIHLGAGRIIAVSVRSSAPARRPPDGATEYPPSAQVFGLLLHSLFLDALDTDAERLDRMNAVLPYLAPAERAARGIRPIGLLLVQPSRDVGVMARGYTTQLPPLLTAVVRMMGGRQVAGSDFLSYLRFDRGFTSDLMDLGYHDALARRGEVEAFLGTDA